MGWKSAAVCERKRPIATHCDVDADATMLLIPALPQATGGATAGRPLSPDACAKLVSRDKQRNMKRAQVWEVGEYVNCS